MIDTIDHLAPGSLVRATVATRLAIPFLSSLVQGGGFPSPAENYIERRLDLNELCIAHPEATYFARVTGDSMTGDRIYPGDILVVDSARTSIDRKIVVVWYDGGHSVKRIRYSGKLIVLESSNEAYLPIYVHPGEAFSVLGVVTFNIQTVY
ncbi:translesion error-prone DNA polymerase V autoproteolytic subunit [Spirosoma rigui]|uniref:translesion error-prone DNA polymerase V autoproteolytic subunit n=1 Tax=Spirosoma rigui TaxID=564064 RepID=UPI0009AF815B|nr:translesion error-prone DNA polymerase V autoproteolytic subunit [Spirosoma rigui]